MQEILDQPFRRTSVGRLRFAGDLARKTIGFARALPGRAAALVGEIAANAAKPSSRILRVESGVLPSVSRSLAIYVHYAPSGRVSDMVLLQLQEYARQGFRIAFVSNAPHLDEEAWRQVRQLAELAVLRTNLARDFGAWSDILAEYYPDGTDIDELLLVNDSVLGPLRPLEEMFGRLRASGDGVFGLTEGVQHRPHLQSYLMLFRGAAAIRDLRAFLASRWLTNRKGALIAQFEIALTRAMQTRGHLVAALWPYAQLEGLFVAHPEERAPVMAAFGPLLRMRAARCAKDPFALRRLLLNHPLNPTHHFAGLLLRRTGFPFLKAEFVRDNPLQAPEALSWAGILPAGSVASARMLQDHLAQFGPAQFGPARGGPAVRTQWPQAPAALPAPAAAGDSASLRQRMARNTCEQLRFSIVVPVYQPPLDVFDAMIRSVAAQTYSRWQLCLAIVDTGANAAPLIDTARAAQRRDPRIALTILPGNGGIARNTNAALELAEGEWVVLLDHDDLLTADALAEIAQALEATPEADFVYSDKDMIDRAGTRPSSPLLKPSWSPDIMLNANYLTHVCAMPTARLREIGGCDPDTDGAQDWDLFLRAIPLGGRVVHVPRILYHWRMIETSVSVGGSAVKPYALEGQLRTLRKYLPRAGWPAASPRHEGPLIRIDWGPLPDGAITLIAVGGPPNPLLRQAAARLGAALVVAEGPDPARAVDEALRHDAGDIVLLVDADFAPRDDQALAELAGPLGNPAIAIVGGQVLDPGGRILDHGVFFQDGAAWPAFRGEERHYNGEAGCCLWYRNMAAVAGGAMAFRRETWQAGGGLSLQAAGLRGDLAFCLRLLPRGRILLNPNASFTSAQALPSRFELAAFNGGIDPTAVRAALPHGDRFLSPRLDAARKAGAPRIAAALPPPSAGPALPGDEARYCVSAYDATEEEISASICGCMTRPARPLRRMLWIVPEFATPYYGGIHTILRAADHLQRMHGVEQCFVVQGCEETGAIAGRIAQAFPALAHARVLGSDAGGVPDSAGPVDAAVCTLWTTAYPLLRFGGARRKFYFVQDWEPDFYPAGAVSCLAEATYRFGYHALCNTPSLAESYVRLGGTADVFLPAVDQQVFHATDRRPRRDNEPFRLFCYARPGTPRNCFEAIAAALIDLKRRHGSALQVVTAGQAWDTATWGLDGIVENLGLLTYTETARLYRAMDAGLVAMATRHPSYLPLELMACGAAVVTNRNSHTGWLLQDYENSLLCEMTRSSIADAVTRLIEAPELRDRLAEAGLRTIAAGHAGWDAPLQRIHEAIRRQVET